MIIFDTGGSNLFGIDSVYLSASDWHPQNIGRARTGGTAGRTTVPIIMDPTVLSIGSLNSTYQIVPIFKLRDVIDCHVDGIWGVKDIELHPLEINFEHNYLKYYKDGKPAVEGYDQLPIRCHDHRIQIQAEVIVGGKSIQGWFLVDTGSGASVDFTASTVKQFGLESLPGKRHMIDITQFGIGDKSQESIIEMQSQRIVIGSDTTSNEVISYLPDGARRIISASSAISCYPSSIWSSTCHTVSSTSSVSRKISLPSPTMTSLSGTAPTLARVGLFHRSRVMEMPPVQGFN